MPSHIYAPVSQACNRPSQLMRPGYGFTKISMNSYLCINGISPRRVLEFVVSAPIQGKKKLRENKRGVIYKL